IAHSPWLLIPGLFVILAVLAFNFAGDGLRDAADPYAKKAAMTPYALLSMRSLQVVLRLDDVVLPILDGIDLDLAPGKVMALVGESGSGKSVTAQAILRILPRTLHIAGGPRL